MIVAPSRAAAERRKHPRFPVRQIVAESSHLTADVVNLSRGGLGLVSRVVLTVGGSYLLEIRDPRHAIEVDATVRWSRLTQARQTTFGDTISVYSSGLSFHRIRTPHPEGIWAGLRIEAVLDPEAPPAETSAEPLIVIRSPKDGTVARKPEIEVTGSLRVPMEGLLVEVNGADAQLSARGFKAVVRLSPGVNRIAAAVGTETAFLYRSHPVTVVYDPPD